MSDETDPRDSPLDPTRRLRAYLYIQLRTLDVLLAAVYEANQNGNIEKDIFRVTSFMIQAFAVTVNTIHKITETRDMSIRYCYGMARSAFELALNTCYIAVSEPEIAQRADRHAMQKWYRNLNRSSTIADMGYTASRSNIPEPDSIPGLPEALAEFTNKNGKETTSWTPLSVQERIARIREVCPSAGLALFGASSSFYRNSSEFIHGTFFSVMHFWGDGMKYGIKETWDSTWNNHFLDVFATTHLSIIALVSVFHRALHIEGLERAAATNDQLGKLVLEWLEEHFGVEKDSRFQ